jgi:hypothetical protein
LADPKHRDFGRIVGLFLDRAWPVQSVQKISVDHTHNYKVTTEMEELAKRLAAEAGMPPEWLLGPNRASGVKLIEGEVIEPAPASRDDDGQLENDDGN